MKYFVVGNGNYARMLSRYLQNTEGIEISGFTVEKRIIQELEINGIPVLSTEEMSCLYGPDECRLFIGIGYRNMNQIKEKEYHRYKDLGYTFMNYIHPTASIEKDVQIGEANNIFEGVIIQSGVRIGDANLIYGGALVAHETTIGSYNSISVKACIAGCTRIGNNCFIGANATIIDHINVSDYTLVGAGAVMNTSTNRYEVVAPVKSKILEGKNSLEFI